jgi:hypothetical protein
LTEPAIFGGAKLFWYEAPKGLGRYEVTQEQWAAVMGENPSRFNGPENPMEKTIQIRRHYKIKLSITICYLQF